MLGGRFAQREVRNYRPGFPRDAGVEGRRGRRRETFSRDAKTEGRMGKRKETLAERMERLGIEITP
ncbi:MAG: hypothetical protein NT157_05220 [Candidatus Micrarchaeota archaeon]|nr:hypothetical protein [Candidatus Micrarchaeota archaeon]